MRPVDLQNNFSKAPLVAREQHVQQTRPDIAQYQASEQQGKDQVRNQRRVKANENIESIWMNPEKQNNGSAESDGISASRYISIKITVRSIPTEENWYRAIPHITMNRGVPAAERIAVIRYVIILNRFNALY